MNFGEPFYATKLYSWFTNNLQQNDSLDLPTTIKQNYSQQNDLLGTQGRVKEFMNEMTIRTKPMKLRDTQIVSEPIIKCT